LYDTRHAVYRPARMSPETLESGYWRAYGDFYRWHAILKGAWTKEDLGARLRHIAYAGGWKKFEPLWDWLIRAGRVSNMLPLLEGILAGFGRQTTRSVRPDVDPRQATFRQVGLDTPDRAPY
jgi:hypothetical protein